eukprot:TRINITY_DN29306_c0_g1_i1.p1 TRINITY_DN29306_c0_g1~~TRINITY_DN29306_c0_g1_i1.p1  ORF type:complete len:253 (-),score=38.32 TRINITY_DN29306_c0_g1_i1:453-1211(-)
MIICFCFFFNDTATTEIYTRSIVGSVRCVQETGIKRDVAISQVAEARNRREEEALKAKFLISHRTEINREYQSLLKVKMEKININQRRLQYWIVLLKSMEIGRLIFHKYSVLKDVYQRNRNTTLCAATITISIRNKLQEIGKHRVNRISKQLQSGLHTDTIREIAYNRSVDSVFWVLKLNWNFSRLKKTVSHYISKIIVIQEQWKKKARLDIGRKKLLFAKWDQRREELVRQYSSMKKKEEKADQKDQATLF